ncbi:hypothetical protein GCM10023091_03870 [Ravibacter arvi]|uniref:Lipoprotein n=1 Tax=Ravibacter arvi TaxID=2051041 RepID=A0ABP8LPX4_9BACT
MKPTLVAIIALWGVLSCTGGGKSKGGSGENIDHAVSSKSKNNDEKEGNSCLLAYQHKYDQLLSESEVLSVTGFSGEVLETEYSNVLKNPETHEFLYKFKNGRMGKIRGIRQEIELPDVVVVGSIQPMSLNTFNQSYRVITDAEKAAAKEALSEAAAGSSGNADAEKALKRAKEQNISKEQIRKTGNALTDAFQEISRGYRTVEDLGDAATWNVETGQLIVLKNGVKFEVRADVSNDMQKNKRVATELAGRILDRCK